VSKDLTPESKNPYFIGFSHYENFSHLVKNFLFCEKRFYFIQFRAFLLFSFNLQKTIDKRNLNE